ncbi:MAG: HYR domain-containing protein [Myxococcota bacterium]
MIHPVRVRAARSTLAVLAAFAAGCDDLPTENGVEWPCRVQVERGGLVVGSHPENGPLWVCTDPGQSPSDVRDQCEDQCEDKWCTWGLTSSFPFISFCTDATCTVVGDNPSPTGIRCDENSDPGGPAKASVDVTGSAHVTVDDESGTASGVTGFVRYTIWDCGATVCPITFAEISLDVPTFDIDGYDITAHIHNGINAQGTYASDTKTFHLDPGVLLINTNFTVDGDAGSAGLINDAAIEGTIDPDNDVFAFAPASFSQDDVTVDLTTLSGTHTHRPPTAVIDPESPIECNQTESAAVLLDGTGSSDPDGDIAAYDWRVDDADVGSGALLAQELPLGASFVELTVVDTLAAFDKEEQTLEVVDTTPPTLTPPPDLVAECTSSAGTPIDVGEAAASDVCDDAVVVQDDALGTYPLGETVVTWTAEDASGNTSSASQSVLVVDTTPPDLSLSVSPSSLWPPNHKLRTITATVSATDVCDAAPTIQLLSITSNEADNGTGDGDTANDIQNAATGTDDRTFDLRAERAGTGTGRVYTITYRATDASGNTTDRQATVTVAH